MKVGKFRLCRPNSITFRTDVPLFPRTRYSTSARRGELREGSRTPPSPPHCPARTGPQTKTPRATRLAVRWSPAQFRLQHLTCRRIYRFENRGGIMLDMHRRPAQTKAAGGV